LAIWLSQAELPQILLIDIVRSLEKLWNVNRDTGKVLPPQTPGPATSCRDCRPHPQRYCWIAGARIPWHTL
jgi:hypothetical protein